MVQCYFEIDCRRKSYKEVSVRSTVHAKNRLTVLLKGKGDGTKLNPDIILTRNDLCQRCQRSLEAKQSWYSKARTG